MAAPLRRQDPWVEPQPPLICLLRLSALACRTAPRGSVEGCGLLDPDADAADYAMALARAMPDVLTRRPVFWRPGAPGQSFDEAWLLALARAIRAGDRDSERFLVLRRVRVQARPILRLLMVGLVERLAFE